MEDSQIVALYLARDEDAIRQSAEKYGARLRALDEADRAALRQPENVYVPE